eukprot:1767106-Pleurochrysis_carterae.AAC.1
MPAWRADACWTHARMLHIARLHASRTQAAHSTHASMRHAGMPRPCMARQHAAHGAPARRTRACRAWHVYMPHRERLHAARLMRAAHGTLACRTRLRATHNSMPYASGCVRN